MNPALPVLDSKRGHSTPLLPVFAPGFMPGLASGRVLWPWAAEYRAATLDQRVRAAQGRSELDGMVDIDGDLLRLRTTPCTSSSFQGVMACAECRNRHDRSGNDPAFQPRLAWPRALAKAPPLGFLFFIVPPQPCDGRVEAVDRNRAEPLWTNEDAAAPGNLNGASSLQHFLSPWPILKGYVHLFGAAATAAGRAYSR